MYLDIFLAFILDVWPSVNLLAYVIGIRIFCISIYFQTPRNKGITIKHNSQTNWARSIRVKTFGQLLKTSVQHTEFFFYPTFRKKLEVFSLL